ncbi:WYL domain-containing protein [Lipingzhangella sp. LS1_29]|uniref:WYL domain-containing protein n=1 Tax=Lipingzhangella rawalii TaxID=2055835 RepID=A0ABU2H0W2_9ACTN|nr:WYL domain-containing protein [Lipingzhangella rawalii]MDS1268947.1 WYL domain-containing protein [Lipingzhangella rawalii]
MAEEKTRRQLNLVICLLATRRYLSAREIRATVQGYERVAGDEAFKRMFERDKDELRASGIPIEIGDVDVWGDEQGYRISRAAYALPPVELRPDEAAVLGLAARAWRFAALGDAATEAVRKLRAADIPVDTEAHHGFSPVVGTHEPTFLAVWKAVRDRQAVTFDYRAPGRDVARRTLEPWGVVNRHGHWYVAGYDRDRAAPRVFRLGRIVGPVSGVGGTPVEVPTDVDVRSLVSLERPSEPRQLATLCVRAGAAHELRRQAEQIQVDAGGAGWDLVRYPYSDATEFAAVLSGYGAHLRVLDPAELAEAVVGQLAAVVQQYRGARSTAAAEGSLGTVWGTASRVDDERGDRRAPMVGTARLRRLLTLVPYALNRGDVRVSDIAVEFGLSERQVLRDLSLLWTCGLPGYLPGDLIDVDMDAARESGEVVLANAETLAAPLRLTTDEAVTLLVGLRLLGELSDGADSAAWQRASAKLREAAGSAVNEFAAAVDVRVEHPPRVRKLHSCLEEALHQEHRVRLRYHSYYRDAVTDREVDPMRLVLVDGFPYLEGWCRSAQDVRMFRLDRVLELEVLSAPAQVPPHAQPRELAAGALQLTGDDTLVTVELDAGARWVTEEYVCTQVSERPGGALLATLRTPDPAWVCRLMLGLGPAARVVAPADLAHRVASEARRALELNRA